VLDKVFSDYWINKRNYSSCEVIQQRALELQPVMLSLRSCFSFWPW